MRHLRAGLLALLTLVGACQSEQPTSPIPLGDIQLTVVSGNTQVGDPGTELGTPLVARITDAAGKKLKGMLVNFRVVSGGGSVFAGAAVSDDNGLVQDYWTLGMSESQVVEVRSVNSTTGGKQTYATFTATFPAPPPPPADVDGDGFTVTQGDCNDHDATVNPGMVDTPDATFTDHDCDGVDGRVSDAIFVSVTGTISSFCGTLANPCASITLGMTQAASSGKSHVYIAVGSYNELVQLRNGVSLFGGYASNFGSRSLANRASITGSSQELTLGTRHTVIGVGLTLPISFVALVVQGANASGQLASGAGIHSVGILLLNSSATVTIQMTDIFAGNGSPGLRGINGSSATASAAQAGGAGGNALESQMPCDASSRGAAGTAGGSGSLQGGAGGAGGTMDTDCDVFNFDGTARSGVGGAPAAVTSALLGTPGSAGGVCASGGAGHDGRVSHGANGTGGTSPVVVSGLFVIGSGSNGSLGLDGGGGGGGGGSGGCDTGTDSYGAGGGGGGSGGLRATSAGAGGGGGGSSIGIYLYAARATTQAVNITRGAGGTGGDGGFGGRGQPGGLGGSGGLADGDSQAGGAGGDGGIGGHSGAGGGGSGGMSVGILGVSGSTTPITGSSIGGGAAGLQGNGGARFDGALAADGMIGALQTILIIP